MTKLSDRPRRSCRAAWQSGMLAWALLAIAAFVSWQLHPLLHHHGSDEPAVGQVCALQGATGESAPLLVSGVQIAPSLPIEFLYIIPRGAQVAHSAGDRLSLPSRGPPSENV